MSARVSNGRQVAHKWMTAAPLTQRATPTEPDINLYDVAGEQMALCCTRARKMRMTCAVELLRELNDGLCEKCQRGDVVGGVGEQMRLL